MPKIKIWIASDHAGFDLKNSLIEQLKKNTHLEIVDCGPTENKSVDYPDFADQVCKKIKPNTTEQPLLTEFGILVCGSGQGMALRANKYSHIRAALVYNDEIAALSREHNNANILCIGSRFCTLEMALKWTELFKETAFAGGRHQTRVAKVSSPLS